MVLECQLLVSCIHVVHPCVVGQFQRAELLAIAAAGELDKRELLRGEGPLEPPQQERPVSAAQQRQQAATQALLHVAVARHRLHRKEALEQLRGGSRLEASHGHAVLLMAPRTRHEEEALHELPLRHVLRLPQGGAGELLADPPQRRQRHIGPDRMLPQVLQVGPAVRAGRPGQVQAPVLRRQLLRAQLVQAQEANAHSLARADRA
mmetsp:Transcript_111547/g.310635  ORF Transcript_111547/g.310635 Transcript_111547/m.310635 type:complete len:206 (+) Transcript_111547:242-859(+)|eukprot:CAMPEP_0179110090 /NCGR_PEP_ID=MMETSP0796-20121207/51363_1 /TAXON_ID=73915 /ORGANISM="Pyrodinium bahamense, Strain pbaha01" /LENGTH=205 /DNA_ID=CAMNT_0020808215 /DNA_START=173 /DNA_END=790 /DNA_ORIENTATION=-